MDIRTFIKKYKNLLIGITLLIWMIFWTTTLLTDLLDEPFTVDPDAPEAEYYHADNIFTVFNRFGSLFFFTVQLNWIIPIFFLAKHLKLKWATINAEFAVSVWSLLMIVVFWTMIAPFHVYENRPFAFISDSVVHGITPLIVIIDFLVSKRETTTNTKKLVLLALTFPFLYYLFSFIVFYATDGVGIIYTFTNFNNPYLLGVTNVPLIILLNIGTIVIGTTTISLFALFLDYMKRRVMK